MRPLIIAAALVLVGSSAARPASPELLQVTGQAGVLGEWELTANVTAMTAGRRKEFSGPMTLKHTGICSQDGPEEKTGEIRLELAGSSHVRATLLVDGVPCTYRATKADGYVGVMSCPDRRDVPLLLWLKNNRQF